MPTFRRGDANKSLNTPTSPSVCLLTTWLRRRELVRVQEQTLGKEVQRTGRAVPQTKPGDPLALRGVPVLGVMGGVIRGTQPEQEAVKRIGRLEDIRERAA